MTNENKLELEARGLFAMSPLKRYFLTRIASFVVTMWAAITITFIIPRMVPGDPISTILAQMESQGMGYVGGKEMVEAYKARFGLTGDMFTQYMRYLWNLLHGDLGISIMGFPMSVQQVISYPILYTMTLLGFSVILSWVLGTIIGTFIGWRRGGKLDATLTPLCLGLHQIPFYFLALILVYFLTFVYRLFPIGGAYEYGTRPSLTLGFIVDYLYHLTLPALSIVLSSLAGWMIAMRSQIVGVLGEDYLLLAEAKGLKKRTIMMKYAFRTALLPSVTGLGMSLGFIMSGALLTETVFAYPGLGSTLRWALGVSDYNTMQGIFLMTITSVMAANLLIDFLYPLIDPRITYSGE